MRFSNAEMEHMSKALEKHLDRRDVIGYAAARNMRSLRGQLREYFEMRDNLVLQYGEELLDEQGKPTGQVRIEPDSERFDEFADALAKFASIEHEPEIFKIKYAEAIGKLSGAELLEVEFMFED